MNIAARLTRLEAQIGEPLVVILLRFAGGRLIGMQTPTGLIERRENESEEDLHERAASAQVGFAVLRELRDRTSVGGV